MSQHIFLQFFIPSLNYFKEKFPVSRQLKSFTAWAYKLEDTRIQEFLPDFNPEPILQAIQQDINGTNKVPMFDEFSNMCRFIEHPAIYSNMF